MFGRLDQLKLREVIETWEDLLRRVQRLEAAMKAIDPLDAIVKNAKDRTPANGSPKPGS